MEKGVSFLGLLSFIAISFALSKNRKKIRWRTVVMGCVLQFIFAVFILKTKMGASVFQGANDFFVAVMDYSLKGSEFVFGPLANEKISATVFGNPYGFIFAFQISGTIILMSSLMAVLYHLGFMQKVVQVFAWIMQKTMATSGSETLASAANIFVGQTEAPLVIRPYLVGMTQSELLALMVGGMANLAGGVLAAYVSFGVSAGHLLASSVMSAPATFVISKILIPETKTSETYGHVRLNNEKVDSNLLDAACRGAGEGATLAFNVMAMLIGFIALIAMLNGGLSALTQYFFHTSLTIEKILGVLFSPFALLMGVPPKDMFQVGSLLGVKTVVNEFVAYLQLVKMQSLDPRSFTIATYALCGFANFSSVAIQIGGISTLIPERRKDLAKLGLLSLIGGTFATFMTACIAGILL